MRRPSQLGQKPRPLHENGTSRSNAHSPAPQTGEAVRQHAAGEKVAELLLDKCRQANAVGACSRGVQEGVQDG